jgi:hypothetical protein
MNLALFVLIKSEILNQNLETKIKYEITNNRQRLFDNISDYFLFFN